MKLVNRALLWGLMWSYTIIISLVFVICILRRRISRDLLGRRPETLEVVWGTEPLLNYKYWSNALREMGVNSTVLSVSNSSICEESDFDKILFPLIGANPRRFQVFFYVIRKLNATSHEFIRVLNSVDIVGTSLNGLIFSHFDKALFTYRVEDKFLKLAGVKRFVVPMGGEAWIYRRIRNADWLHGLLLDYPSQARFQNKIAKRVDYLVASVDYFLPGLGILDGFGRSDVIYPNPICIDTSLWSPAEKRTNRKILISHSPNHRQIKGTQKIRNVVENLKSKGYEVELLLIENTKNSELRRILSEESDIHIDQLHSDGYALSAIEAMSLGICTLTSFSGPVRDFYDKWSFTSECPLVSVNEENLEERLIELITDDDLRVTQGIKCREYVLKYHSLGAFQQLFEKTIVSDFKMNSSA